MLAVHHILCGPKRCCVLNRVLHKRFLSPRGLILLERSGREEEAPGIKRLRQIQIW